MRLSRSPLERLLGVPWSPSSASPPAAATARRRQRARPEPPRLTEPQPATELPAAELSLVAYSTPQAAYEQIIKAFNATTAGQEHHVHASRIGASGDQSRAVVAGLGADYVAFSLEPDVTRLVKEGIVAADWNEDPYAGNVTDSVVVLVVRKGNPKNITGWADLTKPGIEVITANPFTSGGARWNVMAAYGQIIKDGGTEADGVAYLKALFDNVPVQDDSARKSLADVHVRQGRRLAGLRERGDLRPAERAGHRLRRSRLDDPDREPGRRHLDERSTPSRPRRSSTSSARREAQEIFAENGYRPVIDGVDSPYDFPTPTGSVHHRRSRRLDRRDEEVLRPDGQRHGRRRDRHRGLRWLTPPRRCAAAACSRRRSGLRRAQHRHDVRRRPGHAVAQPARVHPARCRRVAAPRRTGFASFWDAATAPEAAAAIRLTVGSALLVALLNAVLGTLIAWVLVRDDFRGKRVVDALIDLPFALPTIVAGLVLLTLYGVNSPVGLELAYTRAGVVVALLFVTLAVRRAHGAAGAARARRRDGAGGRVARRRQGHDLPPDRAAQPDAGDLRRHGAGLRPRDQRVRRDGADLRQPPVQDAGGRASTSSARSRATTLSAPPRWPPCCCSSRSSCCSASTCCNDGRRVMRSSRRPAKRVEVRHAHHRARLPGGARRRSRRC